MSTNPFAAPPAPPYAPLPATPAFKPIDGLQYLRMYQYIFENPNWVTNVLLAALCGLIPVIGPLVLLGYQYEVVIALLMTGGRRYPDFDFNRFADLLIRGLWPFLVQLVASLVLMVPLMFIIMVPFVVLMALAGNAQDNAALGIIAVIGFIVWGLLLIPISILPAMILIPMQIRAGLAMDFATAFHFGWIMDFVKKTWLEMFLGLLFLSFTAMLLGMLGYVACIVGLFFVMPLIYLAQAHLLYELYLLFLSRGGEAVAIKHSPAPQPVKH